MCFLRSRRSIQGSSRIHQVILSVKGPVHQEPLSPSRPKAARSGSFAARTARAVRRACRCCERCRPARAEGGSRIALSGAVATCIESMNAQLARSIIFITCGIGFADAAAADQLLTLLGFIWFGQPVSPSPGAPQLQPSTWKSSPGQL